MRIAVLCLFMFLSVAAIFYMSREDMPSPTLVPTIADVALQHYPASAPPHKESIVKADVELPVNEDVSTVVVVQEIQSGIPVPSAALLRQSVLRNDIDPFEHAFFHIPEVEERDAPEAAHLRKQIEARHYGALSVQALDCRDSLCRVLMHVYDDDTYVDLLSNVHRIVGSSVRHQLWEIASESSSSELVLYVAFGGRSLPDDYSRVSQLE